MGMPPLFEMYENRELHNLTSFLFSFECCVNEQVFSLTRLEFLAPNAQEIKIHMYVSLTLYNK